MPARRPSVRVVLDRCGARRGGRDFSAARWWRKRLRLCPTGNRQSLPLPDSSRIGNLAWFQKARFGVARSVTFEDIRSRKLICAATSFLVKSKPK
jgi:hypothetical protein